MFLLQNHHEPFYYAVIVFYTVFIPVHKMEKSMKIKNRLALYLLSIMFCYYQQIASMHRVPSGMWSAAAEQVGNTLSGGSSNTPATPTGYERPSYVDTPNQHMQDIIEELLEKEAQESEDEQVPTKDKSETPSQVKTEEIAPKQENESLETQNDNESSIEERLQSSRPTETVTDKKPVQTENVGPSENDYGQSFIQGSGNPIDLSQQIEAFKSSSVGRFLGFKDESASYPDKQKEQLKIILFGRLDNEGRRDLAITLRQAWSNIEKKHPDLVQNLLDGFNGKTDVKALEENISDLKELLLELQPSQPKTQFSPAALYPKASAKKQIWQHGYISQGQLQKQVKPISQPPKLRSISTKSKTKFIPQKQREIIKNFTQLPDTDLAPTNEQEGKYKAAIVLKQLNDKREKELAKIAEELKTLEREQEIATQEMKETEEHFHKELTKEIKKSENQAIKTQQLREQLENVAQQNLDQLLQEEIDERNKLAKKLDRSKQMAAYKQDLREMNERSAVEEQATTEKQQIRSEHDRLLQAEKQARQIAIQKQHHREQEEKAQKERASKDEKDKKQKENYEKNRKKKQEQKDLKEKRKIEETERQQQKSKVSATKQQEKSEQDKLKHQQEKNDRHKSRKQKKEEKDLKRQQNEESTTRDQIEKEQRDLQEAISKDIKAFKQAALEKQRNREIAEQFSKLPDSTDLEPTETEQENYNEIIKNELRRKISEEKIKLDDLAKDQTLTATQKVFNSTRPMLTAAKKNPQSLPQEIKEEERPASKSYAQESLNDQTAKSVHSQPTISTSTPPEPAATTTPQAQTYASTQAPAQQTTTSQPSTTTTPPTSTYAKQPAPKSYAKEPFSDQAAEAVHSMFTENEEPPASESNPEPFNFKTTPTQPEPAKAMQPDISSEETTTDESTPDNENNATPNDSDTTPNEQNSATDGSDKDKPSTKKPYKKPSSKSQKIYYQHGTTPHQDPSSQTTTHEPIAPTTTEPLEQTPQSIDTTPSYPDDFNVKDLFVPQEPETITEQPEQAIDIIETESIPSNDTLPDLTYLAPQEQISSRSKLMQPDIAMTTPQPFFTESTDDDTVIPPTPKIVQKPKEDKKIIKQITQTQLTSEIKKVPQPSWWEKITTSVQSWWNDIKSWYIKKIS